MRGIARHSRTELGCAAAWLALMAVVLVTCCVVLPAQADAHPLKGHRAEYARAVTAWGLMATSEVKSANGAADGLQTAVSEMQKDLEAGDSATVVYWQAQAQSWYETESSWLDGWRTTRAAGIKSFTARAAKWFAPADRTRFKNAMHKMSCGYDTLSGPAWGAILDADLALVKADVSSAQDRIAVAIGAIAFAEHDLTSAVTALKKLR